MKLLDTSCEALLAALQPVLGIVERRHTMPILGHVLLRTQGTAMTLTSTDLECQVSAQAPLGPLHGNAATTVAAHKLADILRALPPAQALTMDLARQRLTLSSGRSRFTLHTLPAEDFPAMAPAEEGAALRLPQARLRELLDRVAFAMAAHDIRYYLNGTLLTTAEHRLTAVATDGNRLAVAHARLDAEAPALSFILPRKAVHELQRLLRSGAADAEVTVRVSASQARFGVQGTEFVSKLVEGRFPDYQRVVPHGLPPGLTPACADLLASLQRAALVTSDRYRGVRLDLQPGLLRIRASNAAQEEAEEELPVDYSGPALQVGLNVGYVIDLLTHTTADTVHMALQGPQGSVLFTLPAQPEFAYVVSPMRL